MLLTLREADDLWTWLHKDRASAEAWIVAHIPRRHWQAIEDELSSHTPAHIRAEQSSAEFLRQAWPQLEPGELAWNWHLDAICQHLDAVEAGKIKRLIINVPPGTTKSTTISKAWPAKVWTRRPESRFLCGSYDQSLANEFSTARRRLILSEWYQARWPMRFVEDQNQKQWFKNEHGGEMMATSPGGTGTGRHPHFIVVDDPHNRKQAESPAERKHAIDWIDGTLSTRGAAADIDCAIVVVMQRLDPLDATAHLLATGDWELVLIPMEFEPDHPVRNPSVPTSIGWVDPRRTPGELLDARRFPRDRVLRIAKSLRPHRAAGQLQQRPGALEGDRFKRAWFRTMPRSEVPIGVYAEPAGRYWDCAATQGGGDHTAGVLMVRHKGTFYVFDCRRGQWSSRNRKLNQEECATADAAIFRRYTMHQEQEPGSAGKDAIAAAKEDFDDVRVSGDRATGRKELRWDGWEDELESGNVVLVEGSWNGAFIDEHCAWRWGVKDQTDDQIDAASGMYQRIKRRKQLLVGSA